MNKLRSFLPVVFCLASGVALAVQDCDLNGASVNPANGYTTEGKTGLMRCRDRDSGVLQREQELRNGKFVGLVRYYNNGKLEKEFSVNEQGNREGRGREFSLTSGKVIREETARNGTTIGISRSYYTEGQLKRASFRDDAGKELATVEFTERGQLRDLSCGDKAYLGKDADEAALCGFGQRGKPASVALYGDKGELAARLTHVDGVRVATESYWDNGKLRSQDETAADGSQTERSFAQDGVKRREVRWVKAERGRTKELELEFHESGTLVREQRWQAGLPTSDKRFYLNGQLRSETQSSRRDGVQLNEAREFHDNGKLAFQGSFTAENRYGQQPVGEHRRYDSDGRLRQIRSHDARGKLTREQEFDEKGQPTRDDAVFEDGSRKAFSTTPR